MEVHWTGIMVAYHSAGWEVAREAHEAEKLFRVCTGLLLHRSNPSQKTAGFKASLILL